MTPCRPAGPPTWCSTRTPARSWRPYGSLSGTIRNCAGGPTPWGSWLTCEETTQINGTTRHGYVFDVPASGVSDAEPLRGLGRFSHEAVAIDPATGIVYLTEDTGSSGFYRFVPTTPGDLTAGVLEMMAIDGQPSVQLSATGDSWSDVRWVPIAQPDPGPGEPSTASQGFAQGGTAVSRGEGAWYADGVIYFVSTSGGPVGQGQVFAYTPAAESLEVLFASPSADVLNAPDNVCVSPRGGLVLCEDGSGLEYLHGLTLNGEIFKFAQNNVVIPAGGVAGKTVNPGSYTGSEWCGATFEPKNGNWLFANLQSPGITFAITGPWRKGGL